MLNLNPTSLGSDIFNRTFASRPRSRSGALSRAHAPRAWGWGQNNCWPPGAPRSICTSPLPPPGLFLTAFHSCPSVTFPMLWIPPTSTVSQQPTEERGRTGSQAYSPFPGKVQNKKKENLPGGFYFPP